MEITNNLNICKLRADHQLLGDQVREKLWKLSKLGESDSTLSTCCVDGIEEEEEFQLELSSETLATTREEECTNSDRRV
jgi:hypothetical protein